MDESLSKAEAVNRVLNLLEHYNVGKITLGKTLRIENSSESFAMKSEEPSCFFTTGFLNDLFSAVKNQNVKETRCIAMGNPYCELELG